MTSKILVIGATGNTGKSVVRHLPKLLEHSNTSYRVLGLTRSLDSPASKMLAKLPHVEMQERDWTTIDAVWLRSQDVSRVYIARHNLPQQFAEESALYVTLLQAGVEYVVRVSTNVEYISPINPMYYGRSHWAIENLLGQTEFKSMQWTSLQPNFFSTTYLASTADWIESYRKTGKQETLNIIPDADIAVAMIDPDDVGTIGAHLLALEDPKPHNHAKYIPSGPEDYAGIKVEKTEFKVTSWLDDLIKEGVYPEKVLPSIMAGFELLWHGSCSLASTPTSKEIIDLAPPKGTAMDVLKGL
ncbi:hypothetical protein BGAL_0666g00030 [Botrytis galanthina]|uniref:NmrA-like domain-containing protein n=1 Tax=Botrytis galanthina TaxID=278940 RepID=A0A4V4HT64_9HELO|nr:hypothetical protein BGAL_0666g00030 [Botrytis galanthina]